MKNNWKKLKSKTVYKNKWIDITEDDVIQPDGKETIYAYLNKPPGVAILAVDDEESIYFVEEYRYPIGKSVIQLPTGVIDNDLSSEENAFKELKEETGILADKIEFLGKYYIAAGHETTYMDSYLATGLDTSNLGIDQDGDESILAIKKLHIDEVKHYIKEGRIECGLSLATLLFYFNLKD